MRERERERGNGEVWEWGRERERKKCNRRHKVMEFKVRMKKKKYRVVKILQENYFRLRRKRERGGEKENFFPGMKLWKSENDDEQTRFG